MPRYPSPDAERRNRNPHAFAWVDLPHDGRKGAAPAMPKLVDWTKDDEAFWKTLWRKPQATQWSTMVELVARLALLRHVMLDGGEKVSTAACSAEMRQIEDRLGLSPKAMLQLRWRIVLPEAGTAHAPEPTPAPKRKGKTKASPATSTRGLRLVAGA